MPTYKIILVAFAILLSTITGHAQDSKSLPTEIDLRASYCIAIIQNMINTFSSIDRESKQDQTPELKVAGADIMRELKNECVDCSCISYHVYRILSFSG
jgi:hypothetical protein